MTKNLLLLLTMSLSLSCLDEKQQSEMILRHYIAKNVDNIRSFTMESAVALWNANISGKKDDYQKLIDLELDFNNLYQSSSKHFSPDRFSTFTQNVFTNEQDFQLLKKLKNSGLVTDTILNRQLTVLYQSFMGPQVEADRYKMLRNAEAKLGQAFSGIQVEIGNKKYTGTQIDSLRKTTSDNSVVKKIYSTFRRKGEQNSGDIINLVKMRNEFARNFGYTDYYQLALENKDQTPEKIQKLLEEIETKTHDQFFEAKSMIDKRLAKQFHIKTTDLRPWNYNDDRSSYLPLKFSEKMDSLYRNTDPVIAAAEFFNGIGLPVQDVIERSDLHPRPGKASSTFLLNIDFKNDLRLFSTIRNNQEGMKYMMHLCGHSSHYKNISENIPYLLKDPNTVISEGVATYFENLSADYFWLKSEFPMDSANSKKYDLICRHFFQVDRLFRCRKLLVISAFEREIYRDPEQNLGELWYQLNLKYLGIHPPDEKSAADWATSKYAANLPCNIHNYVLADLFAAQLQHTIEKGILHERKSPYQDNKAIGNFLVSRLYRYGDLLPWEKLIEKVTGEPLNPTYFANYLLGEADNGS